MPFSLKNVKTTYQPMMSRIFEPILGKTMEAYVDNILVKLRLRGDHLGHLREAFELMRRHRLWLNPEKCVFGVGSRNFLKFLVSQQRIEMALGQVKAITKMQPHVTKKQIKTLIGKLETLNRFISSYSDSL